MPAFATYRLSTDSRLMLHWLQSNRNLAPTTLKISHITLLENPTYAQLTPTGSPALRCQPLTKTTIDIPATGNLIRQLQRTLLTTNTSLVARSTSSRLLHQFMKSVHSMQTSDNKKQTIHPTQRSGASFSLEKRLGTIAKRTSLKAF